MSGIPEITLHEKCEDCAFRKGTSANNYNWTQLKVFLCLETSTPFLCHVTDQPAICRGFADALEARVRSGAQDKISEWKRHLYSSLQEIMDRAESGAGVSPEEVTQIVWAAIHANDKDAA